MIHQSDDDQPHPIIAAPWSAFANYLLNFFSKLWPTTIFEELMIMDCQWDFF